MNRYFHVICKKVRHVWSMARKAALGIGIAGYRWREADARLAEALVELERENLSWAMHVHDRPAAQDHKRNR
ncbi:MAG: hypothetical protein ACRESP_13235 [Pseudomonas sp.]